VWTRVIWLKTGTIINRHRALDLTVLFTRSRHVGYIPTGTAVTSNLSISVIYVSFVEIMTFKYQGGCREANNLKRLYLLRAVCTLPLLFRL
jgi:hypothetical protein